MELADYLARDRALQMAQEDWRAGRIGEADVINKARQYESYLLGRPVLTTGASRNAPWERQYISAVRQLRACSAGITLELLAPLNRP